MKYDYQLQKINLIEDCSCGQIPVKNLIGRYIGYKKPVKNQIVAAVLELDKSYKDFLLGCKKASKGNSGRLVKKAESRGFFVEEFPWPLYIPDIVEINQSKAIRSGGPMKDTYKRSIAEMGGYPSCFYPLPAVVCKQHWYKHFGSFLNISGYKQGKILTNQKLVSYIRLARSGDSCWLSMIIGHGDYLDLGVMYLNFYKVIEWLIKEKDIHANGIKKVVYAGYFQGKEGKLTAWKKKMLFKPMLLIC